MIKTGIIGLGKMGISHCAILGAHPDVDLAAVCDSSLMVIDGFKKYSKFECFSDYKKMIDTMKLEALVIASPTKFHMEMVSYALKEKIHVFCEKPFSLKPKEGQQLSQHANNLQLVNQVGYQSRFLGTFNETKKMLHSNLIGEVYHFTGESYGPVVLKEKGGTWRSERAAGGGCLHDYASHTIDLINFLFGKPVEVGGTKLKKIFSKEVEDAVYSTVTLESGLSGQLCVNWSDETHRKMHTQITVLGNRGKIVADATEVKIYLREASKSWGLSKGWTVKNLTDLTDNVDFYLRGEEYSSQIDHFIDCVKTKNLNNRSSFESASQTDELIDLLLKDQNIKN